MFYQLPPAGERIVIVTDPAISPAPGDPLAPFLPTYYDSATSALAASLIAAAQFSRVANPEVLLPAYGCPSLVSAALFAGVRPRIVDLAPDRPWMDLEKLRAAVGPKTVAVIGVDLFGIPERYAAIRAILAGSQAILIQDSAQALPRPDALCWQGDYVIISFGRGKPVSLLHGGAVLSRDGVLAAALPVPTPSASARETVVPVLRARIYNLLLSARLYWLLSLLPFLRLGETRYKALASIGSFNPKLMQLLPVNIKAHWEHGADTQKAIRDMLLGLRDGRIVDLPSVCASAAEPVRLLRYPILVRDPDVFVRLFSCLDRAGLGVSRMYLSALPQVEGLEGHFDNIVCAQADRFAQQVITLPVHSRVRTLDVWRMRNCFLRSIRAR